MLRRIIFRLTMAIFPWLIPLTFHVAILYILVQRRICLSSKVKSTAGAPKDFPPFASQIPGLLAKKHCSSPVSSWALTGLGGPPFGTLISFRKRLAMNFLGDSFLG